MVRPFLSSASVSKANIFDGDVHRPAAHTAAQNTLDREAIYAIAEARRSNEYTPGFEPSTKQREAPSGIKSGYFDFGDTKLLKQKSLVNTGAHPTLTSLNNDSSDGVNLVQVYDLWKQQPTKNIVINQSAVSGVT